MYGLLIYIILHHIIFLFIYLFFNSAFDRDIQSKVTEGGASNALFFYSRCGRFIAKSCTISEMSHIRQVAPQLADYFRQQRNTLITKVILLFYHYNF